MAPKKKGGKKKEKKDKADAPGELTTEDLVKRATLRITSLEQQLIWREEKTAAAINAQKELKERVSLYHADFEREREEVSCCSAAVLSHRRCAACSALSVIRAGV